MFPITQKTETVTKYNGRKGELLGTVHQRDDDRKWQFTNFLVAAGHQSDDFVAQRFDTREDAELAAEAEFGEGEVQPQAARHSLWKVTRLGNEPYEVSTVVVVAEDERIARLAAVQALQTESFAAEFAFENSSSVELIGLALEGVVSGTALFHG